MAVGIENFSQINPADADYLNGDIKDAPAGTPVNRQVYGDIQQFFRKLMRDAGLTPNGQRDNESNGFQLIAALRKAGKSHIEYVARLTQAGTAAPIVDALIINELSAAIVWTRVSAGVYTGTLNSAFTADKTVVEVSTVSSVEVVKCYQLSINTLRVYVTDFGGLPTDNFEAYVTIKVYR